MSLEQAISENTRAVQALTEVWNKLAAQAERIRNGVESGVVAATTAPGLGGEIPLAKAKAEPAAKAAPVAKPEPAAAPEPTEAVSYDVVKARILALISAKGQPAAQELLGEFGAVKGTQLKTEQYPAVLARIEELLA